MLVAPIGWSSKTFPFERRGDSSVGAATAEPLKYRLRKILVAASSQLRFVVLCLGRHSLEETVYVEGVHTTVTDNVSRALHGLRRRNACVVLWTDAPCISQKDHRERYHQVSIMGYIFHLASSSVIFLREGWECLGIACEYLDLAAQQSDGYLRPSLEPHLEVSSIRSPSLNVMLRGLHVELE
ncbi:Putative heterokaryon incompatibility [Colletotrichum destructivum]|uniref:Heterokaryon incompatibility n=1 Tax=Colletotrichum destructivum TaxID=34406 RepID=A0AAX4IW57_9PEZI|nr:Putative heterokaryon incompatibility [Colletotrichum destructivum]